MAVYCISDVHGHKDEFDEMLSKIGFSDDDELYILGDIIDRGPKSAAMLVWAIEEAGDNVHFLRGNHEDMARYVIERDPRDLRCIMRDDVWAINQGYDTASQLLDETDADWRESKLVPWLNSLEPFQLGVKAGDREFALVHAGFDPWAFEERSEGKLSDSGFIDYDFDLSALRKTYELPNGLGNQFAQYMMWIRNPWLLDGQPAPVETVFGHSCVKPELVDYLEEQGIEGASGGGGRVVHIFNKHGIDCGCASSNIGTFSNGGTPSLGCLRLDDMAEFYVPVIPYTSQFRLF